MAPDDQSLPALQFETGHVSFNRIQEHNRRIHEHDRDHAARQ